jgi:DNA-binding response OmpR family regulator
MRGGKGCSQRDGQEDWSLNNSLRDHRLVALRGRASSDAATAGMGTTVRERNPLILVVDDDPAVLKLVGVALRLDGFRVTEATDSGEVLRLMRDQQPALVILDIMMPGADGYFVCQRIRGFSEVPIIMLTAKADVGDIVRGLDMGADDYVVKPFNVDELAARVKAVLHRTKSPQELPQGMLVSGHLVIDYGQRLVRIADAETTLPPIEYRLLCLLAGNAGKVFTYGHLLAEVWGPEYCGEDSHILEAAIARLRKRLSGGSSGHNYIATKRGVGYFFNSTNGEVPTNAAPAAAA